MVARIMLASSLFPREGATFTHLIDSRQELTTCWCWAEQAFIKRLSLTDEQVSGIRGRDPARRADVLTPEHRGLLDALRPRPQLADIAREAGRAGLIADPFPRGECLCP